MTDASRILFVDDEEQILTSLVRLFRSKQYQVYTANSGAKGLDIIKENDVDVIVSDMRMPEMDGAAFLYQSIDFQPESRRILLTGYADQESTVRAINEGQVHQYIMKPWDNESLKETVDAEIAEKIRLTESQSDTEENRMLSEQVETVSKELADANLFADMAKEELLKQYRTTIKVISNLTGLRSPTNTTFNNDIVRYTVAMAKLIKLDSKVISEISNAARLFQVGKLAIDDALLNIKIADMTTDQYLEYRKFGVKGADLLMPLQSLDFAAKVIRHQHEDIDGSGYPEKLKGNKIPLGSRILRIVVDYLQIHHGYHFNDAFGLKDTITIMKQYAGSKYDKVLLEIFEKFLEKLNQNNSKSEDRLVPLKSLEAGMQVSRDVFNSDGMLLVTKESELTDSMIDKIQELQGRDEKEIHIFVHDSD